MVSSNNKTVLGISQNIEALLAYSLGWITGFLFLFLGKDNKFVRFHAMQSTFTFLPLFIIVLLPIIGWLLSFIIIPLSLILWIFLMYKAAYGKWFKLPIVGDFSEKQI